MKQLAIITGLATFHFLTVQLWAKDNAVPNENCGVMVLNSKAALMYTTIKLPSPHWNNISLEEALVLLNRILIDTTRGTHSKVAKASSRNVDEKKVRITVTEEGDISLMEVLAIIAETSSLKIVTSDHEIVFKPATEEK